MIRATLVILVFAAIAVIFIRGVYREAIRDPMMGRFRRSTYGSK